MTQKIAAGFLLVLLVFVPVWMANRGYPKVSEATYQLATATYSACLSRDLERIEAVEAELNRESLRSEMNAKEVQWIESMLAEARDQNWEAE